MDKTEKKQKPSRNDVGPNGAMVGSPATSAGGHFIPLTKMDLRAALEQSPGLSDQHRQQFSRMAHLLEATLHHQYHDCLCRLKDAYAYFDPDSDTIAMRIRDEENLADQATQLFDQFGELLNKANYNRLSQETIQQAMEAAGEWGFNLEVDFDAFEHLDVYSRGVVRKTYRRRRWTRGFRLEELHGEVYQRLVVIFQLSQNARLVDAADVNTVYIKLFKNIPKMDLDSLLPGSRVRMTLFDQSKIILPTASGIILTVVKIVKTILLAGVLGTLALIGIIGGTIGYGVKSFLGYVRTKEKHQLNLTRNLYFQNLDNNAGVLFRLLDEAEAQEFREAVLAYFVLWQQQPDEGWTELELDRAVERYLAEQFGLNVDFEAPDAIQKLVKFRLLQTAHGERLKAVPPDEAFLRLDEAWDAYFSHQQSAAESARVG